MVDIKSQLYLLFNLV